VDNQLKDLLNKLGEFLKNKNNKTYKHLRNHLREKEIKILLKIIIKSSLFRIIITKIMKLLFHRMNLHRKFKIEERA